MNPSDILSADERAALRNAFMAMVVAGVTLTVPAHAMDAEQDAQAAAVADGVSTAVVVGSGAAVEANSLINASPIGLLGVTAVKYAIPYMVRDAEPATRKAVLTSASGIYGGAAVNNLLILVGAGPVAIVGGVLAGIWFAMSTADKVDAEQAQVVAAAIAGD